MPNVDPNKYLEKIKKLTPKQRLVYWIKERHSIYLKKKAGLPKKWTNDSILQSYRFCNVYRELDTVTRWIAKNWRDNHATEPDLWFAMAVARWNNWPDTLAEIGFPVPWRPEHAKKVLNKRKAEGSKVWTGAYMIGTQGATTDKPTFIVDKILSPLWKNRAEVRPRKGETLASFAERMSYQFSMRGFMMGQVVADIKYIQPLRSAKDWDTWAISGPGSRRGMNRVLEIGETTGKVAWDEEEWLDELTRLRSEILPLIKGQPPVHGQDLQNCLCEYDKYDRVLFGEGKPRSSYPGLR